MTDKERQVFWAHIANIKKNAFRIRSRQEIVNKLSEVKNLYNIETEELKIFREIDCAKGFIDALEWVLNETN